MTETIGIVSNGVRNGKQRWRGERTICGRKLYFGSSINVDDAAKAHDVGLIEHLGEVLPC